MKKLFRIIEEYREEKKKIKEKEQK